MTTRRCFMPLRNAGVLSATANDLPARKNTATSSLESTASR
eukprot:CAMPEP_0175337142 /NCGR_PEP_ID=MMETSP0095-20121207/4173_1 /TAXON_ID=311494 /ORGANISM="Alexandrium monilatum, Strain CCMP3105" /LENGTH=40 /DNA_ID= /DNA_START= /DNA_END= /DNA_ORIENTATION=